jgi:hypothetical protein
MNQLLSGSINLTKLVNSAKSGHSAFSKSAKDGNVYFNFQAWINDEANEFGQHMSLLLNSSKEMREQEGKQYIGNAKKVDTTQPIKPKDIDDDFGNVPVKQAKDNSDKTFIEDQKGDDLPF